MMLTMLETAAGEKDREVGVIMGVRVAHVAPKKDARAVQKATCPIVRTRKIFEHFLEKSYLRNISLFELGHFFR